MKILKTLLAIFVSLVLLAACGYIGCGLLVPDERVFSNQIEINASADVVWQVINDRSKYTEWQAGLTKVDIIDPNNWVEYPNGLPDPLFFKTRKDDRPSSMTFEYQIGNRFTGTWTGSIVPIANGVRLETRDSYVARDWLTKVMVYVTFDLDKFAKDWNGRLKDRSETIKAGVR